MLRELFFIVCSAVFILNISGCAKKKVPAPTVQKEYVIADERDFPQNLDYYAKQAGPKKRLLDQPAQAAAKQRFDNIYFGPWEMTHGTVSSSQACIKKARGYKSNGLRWTQPEWDEIVANANLATFPSTAFPAITVRNTDLREIPTHQARYDKTGITPQNYPFDDFQYSLLPVGMPLFISHRSADGRWYFAECPLVGGWIDANDVAMVDESFKARWQSYPLAAIIKDQIPLPQIGTPATIGTVLPQIKKNNQKVTLALPQKTPSGEAKIIEVAFNADEVAPHPLPLTPENMATLGNRIMGQHYGWGGMYGLRDCSATTHDLLAPFGVWLPRNSKAQARVGVVNHLNDLTAEQKEASIKNFGTPFLSLVGLPGHITMYVGTHNGRVALLHNVWGVRTIEGANDNARHVIGKTLVTSMTPGAELPDLYRPRTFVDRIRSLNTPGY